MLFIDIDECVETPGVCNQYCENLVGTYHCKCADNYQRSEPSGVCRKTDGLYLYTICVFIYMQLG